MTFEWSVHGGHRAGRALQDRAIAYIQAGTHHLHSRTFQQSVRQSPAVRRQFNICARAKQDSRDMRRIIIAFAGKTCNAGAVVTRAARAFCPIATQRMCVFPCLRH